MVKDAAGREVTGDTLVTTGMTVSIQGNQLVDTYVIAVQGDVNGDGQVSVSDVRQALRAAVGKTKLAPPQEAAADVDRSGGVPVSDARRMLRYAVGKIGLSCGRIYATMAAVYCTAVIVR